MPSPSKLLTVIPLLWFGAAWAGEQVDRSLPAKADGSIQVSVVRGHVEISGWDQPEVKVTGTLDDLTRQFTFDAREGQTRIIVEMKKSPISYGEGSDLEIFVPKGSQVSFNGVSTDFAAEGLRNGISLVSVSGELRLQDIERRIRVNTVSGDLDILDCKGPVHATSVSGGLRIRMTAEEASLDSVSGDIAAELGAIRNLRANAVSGETDIKGSLAADGQLTASSISGDIRLGLAAPLDARIEARTSSGDIVVDGLGDGTASRSMTGGSRLDTTLGKGSASIDLQTVSGDILLEPR